MEVVHLTINKEKKNFIWSENGALKLTRYAIQKILTWKSDCIINIVTVYCWCILCFTTETDKHILRKVNKQVLI